MQMSAVVQRHSKATLYFMLDISNEIYFFQYIVYYIGMVHFYKLKFALYYHLHYRQLSATISPSHFGWLWPKGCVVNHHYCKHNPKEPRYRPTNTLP